MEADTPNTATKAHGYVLVATCSQALNRKLQEEWITGWKAETRGSALRKIQQKPSPQVLRLHKAPRPVSSLIVQMRTGKIGLRQFLFRRKVAGIEDDQCPCGQGVESVHHVLLTAGYTANKEKPLDSGMGTGFRALILASKEYWPHRSRLLERQNSYYPLGS